MIKDKNPYDSLLVETRRLIVNDTVLLAKDSLKAKVRVVVISAVAGFGSRLNGLIITTNEETIPIFHTLYVFWINCFGAQGKGEEIFSLTPAHMESYVIAMNAGSLTSQCN